MDRAFRELQSSIVKGTDFKPAKLADALRFNPDSPESFSTFTWALSKGKLDPTMLLVHSSIMAIQNDVIFVRHAGLALRYGANPNTYVTATFDFGDEQLGVPIHLGKKIWDLVPRTVEDSFALDLAALGDLDENVTNEDAQARLLVRQNAALDILCLMAIKGMVSDAKITNATLLTESGINATRFANYNPGFFSSVYGDIISDEPLGTEFGSEIKYFEEWKNRLQNAYGANPKRDVRIVKYALLLDDSSVLTLEPVFNVIENVRLMFFFQDLETLKSLIPRFRDLRIIGIRETEAFDIYESELTTDEDRQRVYDIKQLELTLLDYSISYYSLEIHGMLLDFEVVPDYSLRTQTIRAAKLLCGNGYLLQCQILNTMTVDYVTRGYGLDSAQLEELSFSPLTLEAVRREYSVPAWQYMCKIKEGDLDPVVQEMGRQVGIPMGSNKTQICSTLEGMIKNNPSALKRAAYEINRNRIALASVSPADVASGRTILKDERVLPASLSVDELQQSPPGKKGTVPKVKPATVTPGAPVCTNSDTLTRPIEDYPAIDRVTYGDGKYTWCFTSDLFPELLDTGINPWATNAMGEMGDSIPEEILFEMSQKLDTIQRENLVTEPGSVSEGIDSIFDNNPVNTEKLFERATDRRLEEFYDFLDNYGIDRSIFTTFTSPDYQILADSVLSSKTRIVVDKSSPTMALRDFASATLTEIKYFGNGDSIGRSLQSLLTNPQGQ